MLSWESQAHALGFQYLTAENELENHVLLVRKWYVQNRTSAFAKLDAHSIALPGKLPTGPFEIVNWQPAYSDDVNGIALVPADLAHPQSVGLSCNPIDLHTSAGQGDEEQEKPSFRESQMDLRD